MNIKYFPPVGTRSSEKASTSHGISQHIESNSLQEQQKHQQLQIAPQSELSEKQCNQRVSELKAQEQLVRANLKHQVQQTGLEKQTSERREGPRQELAALRRIRREILSDGESRGGRYNRKDLVDIERRIRELNQILVNRAIRELQQAPQRDVIGPDSNKNKVR